MRSISELIADEHPQIIALVISYLDAGLGADVLGLLPENLQSEVIRRIATLQTVGPDALRELEQVMQKRSKRTRHFVRLRLVGLMRRRVL